MAPAVRRALGVFVLAGAIACEALLYLASRGAEVQPAVIASLAGLPHAATYLFLLWFFGRTLIPGKDALITSVARRFHGTLPDYMESYTRRLTASWCLFFAGQLAGSVLLLGFASLSTWSFFVNVLNLPLVAAMFVADYLYRTLRFPRYAHPSIAQAIVAFAKYVRPS
jgi:uncharacterized membrane protein